MLVPLVWPRYRNAALPWEHMSGIIQCSPAASACGRVHACVMGSVTVSHGAFVVPARPHPALSFTTSPFAHSLCAFLCVCCLPLTVPIVPFIQPSCIVQGPLHYCYLRVYSHPAFCHFLMSLSATLSPTNIAVEDNNNEDTVPRETPCCYGTVFCTLDLCLSVCVPWNNNPMR